MGIAAISTAHAKSYIENGTLIRILPEWYADLGETNLYFSSKSICRPRHAVLLTLSYRNLNS